MLSALKPTNENNSTKELELQAEFHKKEINSIQIKHKEELKFFQQQLQESKNLIDKKEAIIQEYIMNNKKFEIELQSKSNIEKKLKKLEEEYEKLVSKSDLDAQVKLRNLNCEIEKMKADHMREMKKQKERNETILKEQKAINDRDIELMEKKITDLTRAQPLKEIKINKLDTGMKIECNNLTQEKVGKAELQQYKEYLNIYFVNNE